jgi:hypothetical protein
MADFILNVIARDDGDVHGKIKHCESGETKDFRSLIEMILLIDGKLDQLKFQLPTSQTRSWNIHKILLGTKGGGRYK